jgi:Secretion system C-terminal sorting domain
LQLKAKLKIISELVSTANVALEGTITGDIYSKDVGGKAQIQKPGSFGWKDVPSFINGKLSAANGSINSFVTQSQLLSQNIGLIDTVNKKSAFDLFGNFLKNNQFLKSGLNAAPWLKSAVGILDIFTGGGKTTPPTGPQEVKLMPLSVNLTAKLNGTITVVNQYHDIVFTNPGSKDAQLDPDVYPYYNEVLGVFNLVKTPIIFRTKRTINCGPDSRGRSVGPVSYFKYRFDADSLFYVLNAASDLTIQNMKAAIVIKTNPRVSAPINMANQQLNSSFQFFEGKDAVDNTYKFRTDYFDIKCLDREIFNYEESTNSTAASLCLAQSDWRANSDSLFIKFMINLKRNNATANTQNVLLVLTYPIKYVTDAIQVNIPTFATCDSTLLPQATNTFVNSYCNSTAYNNLDRQSRAYQDSIVREKKLEKDGISLFPNPSNGNFTMKLKSQNASLNQITVYDMLGRLVYTSNEGNLNLDAGLLKQLNLNLSNGAYILSAKTTIGILKSKFIIIK